MEEAGFERVLARLRMNFEETVLDHPHPDPGLTKTRDRGIAKNPAACAEVP